MFTGATHEVTRLLIAWSDGDVQAPDQLMPLVYNELRQLARGYLRRERGDHTLQPTALVHEAYLRLVDETQLNLQSRAHFFGIAARLMRRILVDHARLKAAAKRGGGAKRVPLEDADAIVEHIDNMDLVALDEALLRFAQSYPRQSEVVELRFFGGLAIEAIGEVLQVAPRTVVRDWEFARCWLKRALDSGDESARS